MKATRLTTDQKRIKTYIELILSSDKSASYKKIKSLCAGKDTERQKSFEKAYKSLKRRNLI